MRMEKLNDELTKNVEKLMVGFQNSGLAKETTTECVLTPAYDKYAERIRNLEVRDDDIWVVTFPKAGK